MPKSQANEQVSEQANQVVNSDIASEEEGDHCRCCHCGAGQEDIRSQSYIKMREHLQQRLKEKHTGPGSVHDLSNSSKCSSSRNSETIGNAELDFLVNYIEGNQIKKPSNPKKAAKKARQKQKKLEELAKQKEKEEAAAAAAASAAAQAAAARVAPPKQPVTKQVQPQKAVNPAKGVPNGMVRITHNPLTNSAVITPLYGPLEPSPSYLQQPLPLQNSRPVLSNTATKSQPVSVSGNSHLVTAEPLKVNGLTSAVTQPTQQQQTPQQPQQTQQMVTIRRVMQPNLSEPVVTVTLKGEVPANDRILFTLVNGQVIPTEKTDQPQNQQQQRQSSGDEPKSKKKQKKLEKKKLKKLLKQNAAAEATANKACASSAPTPPPQSTFAPPHHQYVPQSQFVSNRSEIGSGSSGEFSLENFRLPPGITLTRVHGTEALPHPDLPMRMVPAKTVDSGTGSGPAAAASTTSRSQSGSNPIIVTSPLTAPKNKDSLGGLTAPNVIVVDTRKIPQQQQQPVKAMVQMQSVAVQTGEDDFDEPEPLSKQQRKKLRRRERLLQQQREEEERLLQQQQEEERLRQEEERKQQEEERQRQRQKQRCQLSERMSSLKINSKQQQSGTAKASASKANGNNAKTPSGKSTQVPVKNANKGTNPSGNTPAKELAATSKNPKNGTSNNNNSSSSRSSSSSTCLPTKQTKAKQQSQQQTQNQLQQQSSDKGKKKKKRPRAAATCSGSEDKWEENVFVPKSDLDLERGDMDEDERELEAFKRFCFNTVPPERKEKVRIHLNVKDIFGKKSNGQAVGHHVACKST